MAEPVFLADVNLDGYSPSNISCITSTPSTGDLQSRFKVLYSVSNERWQELFAQGRLTNNTNLALKDFRVTRPGRDERHQLLLEVAPMTYLDQRITADIWMQGLSETERKDILSSGRQSVDRAFSRFFGLTLVVLIDGEKHGRSDRVLVARRSRAMKISPGWYTFGVGETMSEKDLSLGEPDVFEMARRGLKEEIGVTLIGEECQKRIKLIALALDELVYEWQIFGYVDLRTPRPVGGEKPPSWDVTLATIKRGISQGRAKDKYEHESIEAIDLTPERIAGFLRERPVFHTFKVCIFLVLLSDQRRSEEELEAVFTKYVIPDWKGYTLSEVPEKRIGSDGRSTT